MNFFSSDIFIIEKEDDEHANFFGSLTTRGYILLLLWEDFSRKMYSLYFAHFGGLFGNKCQVYHDDCNMLRLSLRDEFYLEKYISHCGS